MKKVKLDMKSLHKAVATKHEMVDVGSKYFLSHFHDKEGAIVRVLSKSTKTNRAGFNSSVNVEVLESDCDYYKPGALHTVNAANLYQERKHASPAFKFGWEK
jgi:hypothetical protein